MNELKNTSEWFKIAIPFPTRENLSTQIGCVIEEVAEMAESLNCNKSDSDFLHNLGNKFKNNEYIFDVNKIKLLDSLADQIVTVVGVAHMLKMDIIGALHEVNSSNFSKFEEGKPVFKQNGKIGKGAKYKEPNLSLYINDK